MLLSPASRLRAPGRHALAGVRAWSRTRDALIEGHVLLNTHFVAPIGVLLGARYSFTPGLCEPEWCALDEYAGAPRHGMCLSGRHTLLDAHSSAPKVVLLDMLL